MDIVASNAKFPPIKFPVEEFEGQRRYAPLGLERFVAAYLSHDLKDKSTGKEIRGAKMHRDIAYVISNPRQYPLCMIVAPRGSAKSFYETKAGPLYHALVTRMFPEILIISASDELAADRLSEIKREIANNEVLIKGKPEEGIKGFGELSTQKWKNTTWNANRADLANGVTIHAKGRGSSMRGCHPQYIIIDDIEGDEGALSPTECAKITRWIKNTVMPMQIDEIACLLWDGTFLGPEAVLYNAYHGIGWSGNFFRMKYGAFDKNGHSYWPERFPDEWLARKKEDLGSMGFAAEYLNEPFSIETPIIRREWLKYFTDSDVPPQTMKIMSIDPAISMKKLADKTAFGVMAANPFKEQYFGLHFEHEHYSFDATIRRFFDLYKIYHPEQIRIEAVAYQDALRQQIVKEASNRGISYLPIVKEQSNRYTGDLAARLKTVSPAVERGQVYLRKEDNDLILQMVNFPAAHDDLVQSFYSCMKGFEGQWRGLNEDYNERQLGTGPASSERPAISSIGY
jgi:predicted phage terminase large subunit-like protein